jgi:two-component system, OmpR family, phosphate regulon sensor histidine kinase PhoR
MTATDERGAPDPDSWWTRIAEMRVLIAAAIMLLALVAIGALAIGYAVAALAVIVIAAIGEGTRARTRRVAPPVDREATQAGAAVLDAVIAALPDPTIAVDRAGVVVALNARASAMAPALRRGAAASLALRVPELVEAIRRACASGEASAVEFSERVPVDRWFAAHAIPVEPPISSAGDTRLVLVSFHDLTPLRQVEQMRANFIANASHELRTPLASLSGFIDTLQGPAREDAAARERFLAIMKLQAARMARLIDDLLSLSRIELREHIHPDTSTNIVAIVRQVADALQMLARERDVAITIEAPVDPLIVRGDRDELVRMFENLVENALKYGTLGKRVEITVACEPSGGVGEALISVRDYGPGIAPEHLPRLTERFYRIDVGQSRAEGGTGLGLALVKHILNRHRGRLAIESTPGNGATFTVRLPLAGAVD